MNDITALTHALTYVRGKFYSGIFEALVRSLLHNDDAG